MNGCIVIIVLGVLVFTSCKDVINKFQWKSSQSKDFVLDTILYSNVTEIYFQDTMINLGTVKEGGEYQVVYRYQNKGKLPLMLFNVSPSCGCTIAEYSHDPLASGKWDSILAKFDSKDKPGSYQKNIKVNCNTTQKVHDLYFKVNVVK